MNIDYMSKKQAVLCSSEAFGEKFVIPEEEVELAPRKETFDSSFCRPPARDDIEKSM